MTVVTPRENWTDGRLDDLKDGMHREFAEVRTEIRDLRAETNARFDALNRNLFLGAVSIIVTLVGAIFARGLL